MALADSTFCGDVAWALASVGIVPTVGFAASHASNCLALESYGVAVLDGACTDEVVAELLSSDLEPPAVVLRACGERGGRMAPGVLVDETVDAAADAADIADRVVALLNLRRMPLVPSVVTWGPLQLELRRRQASWRGERVKLTTVQFRIMEILVLAAGGVVSHSILGRRVWGEASFEDTERLVSHIRRIRKLLEEDSAHPRFLLTVRGEGFRLADEDIVEGVVDLRALGF